jgi:Ca2+-binding EF-hand superfamily protein
MKRLALLCLVLAAAPALADESMDRYFEQLDLNGDGYVSLSEAAGDPVIVNRFDRADRNRDGKLSRQEFARLPKVKVRLATKKKAPSAAVGASAPKKQEKASGG